MEAVTFRGCAAGIPHHGAVSQDGLDVAVVESQREVTGYLGDKVTLLSEANRSWNLSKIEWSIYSNNTWIATYRNGNKNINRLLRYKGRLDLNIVTGDLMIQNLTTEDEMEYSVDLINDKGQDSVRKIRLRVRQHLQSPTILPVAVPEDRGCLIVLRCDSPDDGVKFSWRVKSPNVTILSPRDHEILVASLNSTESHVEFTCITSNDVENSTSHATTKCNDDKPQPKPNVQPRCRNATVFFIGFLLGGTLVAILTYTLGEQIKAAWEYVKS
ncbi:cell adhesion molecule CEACAM15 [Symphorus nematophorus]